MPESVVGSQNPQILTIAPTTSTNETEMDTSLDSKVNTPVEGSIRECIRSGIAHVRVRECTYTWTLTDMSYNLRAYGEDDYIWSSKFQTGNNNEYVFRLLLYPDGCNEEHRDYLCIEIQNYGITIIEDGQIYAELAILHASGEERCKKTEAFYPQKGKARLLFHAYLRKMVLTDTNNGLVVDDRLTLKCRLYFDSAIIERFIPDAEMRNPQEVKPDCRLKEFDEFEQMLESGIFSDVRIRAQGTEFRVHRSILATRSRVFADMISKAASEAAAVANTPQENVKGNAQLENMEENAQQENEEENFILVDMQDTIRADVLCELLRFVYAGKVNGIDEMAKDLLVVAAKFQLDGLKTACEETLIKGLSIENVGEMLAYADKHKTDLLAKSAMEYFKTNAKRVIGTDNFKSVMQSCPFWITAMVNTLVDHLM